MRENTTEAGDVRRMLQALVCDLPKPADDEPMFASPWELRAFALAVSAYHGGQFQWHEFQQALIASIQEWENGDRTEPWSYYQHWFAALENLLAAKGVLDDGVAVDERTRAVLSVPKDKGHHAAHREPVAVSPAIV
jgi:nitrile hydratase accessory protein